MEVHFAAETEKKLKDLAAQSGRRAADELVQDVIEGRAPPVSCFSRPEIPPIRRQFPCYIVLQATWRKSRSAEEL